MKRLIAGYIFSILLIPIEAFGIFHKYFIDIEFIATPPFITFTAVFMFAVSMFLCWYFSNLFIIKESFNFYETSIERALNFDSKKISQVEVESLINKRLNDVRLQEDLRYELFGFCIPFFVFSMSVLVMQTMLNPISIISSLLAICAWTILISSAGHIVRICDISKHTSNMKCNINPAIRYSRGIQYYGCKNFVMNKFKKSIDESLFNIKSNLSNKIWSSWSYAVILFLITIIAYVVLGEYVPSDILDISGVEMFFIVFNFFFTMCLVSYLRYRKIRNIKFEDFEKYQIKEDEGNKIIDREKMFLAFHGVYYQDPSELLEKPILENLSFSVLPGEFIALTGTNIKGRTSVFDLILKYYSPQSGNIYISGTSISKLSADSIRSEIGIFDEHFCMINGSVFENISIASNNIDMIDEICNKLDLTDHINEQVFDKDGNVSITQDVSLKLQIARLALRKPAMILINEPELFETKESEEIFNDYVKHISKNKCILLNTNNPKMIVYSSKVLFLGNSSNYFGTHAELASYSEYQKFLTNSK